MNESQTLLAAYVREGSESAFRELVTRYIDLVYSTAARLLEGDGHGAEDVAQTVFIDLARLAGNLPSNVMLGGWLHRHTCFVASKTRRREWRRQRRERQAVEMNTFQNDRTGDFTQVAPILDEAINDLGEADRTAILLRFFEQYDFGRIGQALGSGEDAARMRVTRALEKLESLLRRRGVTTSAAFLSVSLAANLVKAAPAGLAMSISTAAALSGAVSAATIATQTTVMNWINAKVISALVATGLVAGTGTYVVQQHQVTALRENNEQLIAHQETLAKERDGARSAAAADTEEFARLRRDQDELLRLRGEVVRLRQQTDELKKLHDENRRLEAALRQARPVPVSNQSEANADGQKQIAYGKMSDAKLLTLGLILYAKDNQDQFPADLSQVTRYVTGPNQQLTGSNQFELVVHGSLAELSNSATVMSTIAVRETQPSLINGKWCKVYGFADGHAELRNEPPEGFETWEKAHMLAAGGQ